MNTASKRWGIILGLPENEKFLVLGSEYIFILLLILRKTKSRPYFHFIRGHKVGLICAYVLVLFD